MSSRLMLPKSRKELYHEEYEATKKGGESFFPETIVRDAIVALIVVAVIAFLAIFIPVVSEPPADPTSTTYNPRPEWYFLFFFEFLKLFPGALEPVAAVLIPIIALSILILLPFLDRKTERRYSRRKGITSLGLVAIAIFISLEVTGTLSAPARPAGETNLVVQKGIQVYREINCAYCHAINGAGGAIGPDLSSIGSRQTPEQLTKYLSNPDAMIPETLHPKLQFTQEELNSLVAYLSTLGARIPFTEQAPQLFEKYCSGCHLINGKGGTLGPDLSTVGSRRTFDFLNAFTSDPKSVISGATMPAFKNVLTVDQIKDIAAYLYSLKESGK